MHTPNHIFEIARHNPIAKNFLEAWMRGSVEWEEMLFELARELEKTCNRIVDKNQLRLLITENTFSNTPSYVLGTSLIPELDTTKTPLERQSTLIEAIILINEFYKNFLKMAENQLRYSATPILVVSDRPPDSNPCSTKVM